MTTNDDLLDECFKRDIVWSLASAVSVNTNEETTNNVASWTPFNKEITAVQHGKHFLSIYLLFQKLLNIKFVRIFLTIYVIFFRLAIFTRMLMSKFMQNLLTLSGNIRKITRT